MKNLKDIKKVLDLANFGNSDKKGLRLKNEY